MEDLNGLQWTSSASGKARAPATSSTLFPSIRATPPISGRSTPLAVDASNPPSKPATPANDSFANLVSFNASVSTKNLSLQEQQKRLQEQKDREYAKKSKDLNTQYGGGDGQFWDNLGSGRSTPAATPLSSFGTQSAIGALPKNNIFRASQASTDEEDILAAFNSSASVDSSTHFPKPIATPSPPPVAASNGTSRQSAIATNFDDDDPFGLSQMPATSSQRPPRDTFSAADDDDVLGLLGKPVSDISHPEPKSVRRAPSPARNTDASLHPQESAVAELVDMGFPPEKARQALEATESGTDVQSAVGWLLNQAHEQSKQKSQPRTSSHRQDPRDRGRGQTAQHSDRDPQEPAWMKGENGASVARRRDRDAASADKDPAQMAAEFGTTLFKTAGSLWKQGARRMQQAVQEFNSEPDANTPKWMRESSADGRGREPRLPAPRQQHRPADDGVERDSSTTDEALMLESGRSRPTPQHAPRQQEREKPQHATESSRDHSHAIPSKLRQQDTQPAFLRQQNPDLRNDSFRSNMKSGLNRQATEEQASTYTSSARRRKPTAQPPVSASEPDLLDNMAATAPNRPATAHPPPASTRPINTLGSMPSRPKAQTPGRTIPSVPPNVMAASHGHRESGTSQFKRGDFSAAHASYTSALTQIPTTHPITIVLLTNRALTALKIGEPKTALNDANNALTVIGPSKGESETVLISSGETPKPMREYFGKALMRKAEALEQMEKWSEAATVWREAVDGGHGGSTSMQGRSRCEKAAGITKPETSSPAPAKRPSAAPVRSTVLTKASDAAVSKLRAANAAAEKADDEKFALADHVDAKLNAWKGGKADNLRALLGSLDTVLWPEAEWKKIGMSELVLPNKVKIQYMKGIAKVHPDKIPTTATTEQRMIAGAVFSTLNEAWDKFKKENNL